ncbi:hypothetical protein RvY_13594-2 [Ramazzottius varieornatus]|nr:hypothetical protein RvY_13594-2 [Ramazzottius varieornatus]
MELARALREEQESCAQLMNKRTELRQLGLSQNDQIARLRDYTSKLTDEWREVTPEKLLQKLEDRVTSQRRAVNEVLPRAIGEERKALVELAELLKLPDFTERNLNELRIKAQMLQTEVFNMSDKLKTASQTPQLAEVAANQAQLDSLVEKKKELASRNEALHREIREVEQRMGIQVDDRGDATNLSRKLLNSAEENERKKNVVEVLEAERRTASRTYSILADEHQRTKNILTEWEKRTGLSPLAPSSGQTDVRPTTDGRPLADQTHELEEKVASRRKEVAQLLSELQPLRQKHKTQQDIIAKENQRQNAQDLQTSVDKARDEVATLNSTIISQQLESQYADILLERATNEEAGQKFMQTTRNYIQSENSKLTTLKTEHETSRASHAEITRQANAWKDLDRLFDMKMEHLNEEMDAVIGRTRIKESFDRIMMA